MTGVIVAAADASSAGKPAMAVEIRNLKLDFLSNTKSGPANTVYDGLDLNIEDGAFTILLGPSGCGKSSLLNVIDGLVRPRFADTLKVLGQDPRNESEIRRRIAYVFQEPRLLPWLTVRQNCRIALKGLGLQPRSSWDVLIEQYLAAVGLEGYSEYYPRQLSGGMQQRAAICRALVNEPSILLMDEPFSHLDEITASQLRRELLRLWSRGERRRTVVFVSHDISEAVALGSRVLMFTRPPSEVCFSTEINLSEDRASYDEEVVKAEQELRAVFAERVGVYA